MKIADYILDKIPTITLNDTVALAKQTLNNYPISHLFVVENEKLLGCLAENDIRMLDNNTELLKTHDYLLQVFFADNTTTVTTLLTAFADNDTTILPVINADRNYIGYYDLRDVLDVFTSSPFIAEKAETLIVEKLEVDYSMSEVAQIVETNNAKLLGLYVSKKEQDVIQITLKIAVLELQDIMQTFRRYDYKIVSTHDNDVYLEDLKNRSEYLQKYLNM